MVPALLGELERDNVGANVMHSTSATKRKRVVFATLLAFACALVAAACGPDKDAPQLSLTFPTAGGSSNASTWASGCASGPGVCGVATDGSGVASVRIAIRELSTGRYWNGRRFAPPAPHELTPSGTSTWSVPLPFPADGGYEVYGRATDTKGNTSALALLGLFTIDTAVPAAPMITAMPGDGTMDQSATFSFVHAEAGVTFLCALDGAASQTCSAPEKYDYLEPGDHSFSVAARDAAGNTSAAAAYSWEILPGTTFSITGDVDATFNPGASLPLELSFINPHDFPIEVDAVSVVVEDATTVDGLPNPECVGSENLVVTQAFTQTVVVDASSTQSLSDLGVDIGLWPRLDMPNLPVNQDACKGASFTLTYTGTAVQP